MTDKLRGNAIEWNGKEWVYSDTKRPTVDHWREKSCGYCGLHFTKEGHDGCLGTLPGVMNACCGHGDINDAYVQFLDGVIVRGDDASKIMDILRRINMETKDYQVTLYGPLYCEEQMSWTTTVNAKDRLEACDKVCMELDNNKWVEVMNNKKHSILIRSSHVIEFYVEEPKEG